MKKITALLLSLMLVLSMTACGSRENETPEENVQLANPYVDCENAEQMSELAGLEVSLPENMPDWVTETVFRAIPGQLAEVIYTGEDNEIRVRIKNGSGDISGVYDSDTREEKDIEVSENSVHLKGESLENGDFTVYVSTWQSTEGRTYSVTSVNGVPEELLVPILEQIR